MIKERPRHPSKQPTYPVPNFIHLQADKIPGYETFKLDEYIRYVPESHKIYEIYFRAKPDVIHYVDSPVIKPKIKESKEEDVIKNVTIIKDKEDKKTSSYGKFEKVTTTTSALSLSPVDLLSLSFFQGCNEDSRFNSDINNNS